LLAQEAADAIRAAARAQGYTERSSYTVAGAHFDWSAVLAAGGSLSLFADKQIVEIRIPSGKPGKDGSVALQQIAADAPGNDSTLTLVMLPKVDKMTRGGAWFGALEAHGITLQVDPVERAALPAWIAQRLALQGQRVKAGEEGQRTLQFFADRVEGNLLAARQEVEKLALLLPQGEVTLAALREAVTDVSRFERDTLIEAIHAGDAGRIARALAALEAEGEPLPLLLWTLADEIRLLMALAAGERPRRFLPPERMEAVARTARRHDAASFERELLRAHRIDRMIKGVEIGDPWDSLLELALGIAGKRVMDAAAA